MKYLICLFLFTTIALNAQENESRREFVQEGESVKFTEYHVNGNISQTGYFLDGKNHGDWVSYDLHGNKISEGSFEAGKKVNRWLFWNGDSLIEVDFKDNKILRAKKWKKPELLASSSD